MVLKWFDAGEAKDFGKRLGQFLIEKMPPESAGKKEKSPARKKEVLNQMIGQIAKFKQEHKLNIYKKAQLGNTFKWTLNDAGYDQEFVDELTKTLMTFL